MGLIQFELKKSVSGKKLEEQNKDKDSDQQVKIFDLIKEDMASKQILVQEDKLFTPRPSESFNAPEQETCIKPVPMPQHPLQMNKELALDE